MLITSMNYNEILTKINDYLPVRENEKDKFGEVFTPPTLINELLDQLPSVVWSNPSLTWLDPASGIGNFFMIVFHRLMSGLAKKLPNKNKRSHHILTKMLFMTELNPKNVRIARTIFGTDAQIVGADFLTHTFKQTFDIIIGNLPFNEETNKTNKKTVALWTKFVDKSLDLLNENGYLAFIHPPGWRSPDNKTNLWATLVNKHVLYLHIYGAEATKKMFNVNTKVDLYVLQNSIDIDDKKNKNKKTSVIDELGQKHQIDLTKLSFLPNYHFKEIERLTNNNKLNKNKNNRLTILHDSKYSTSKTKEIKDSTFKYPVISSITSGNKINLRYSTTKNNGHFDVAKVIINSGRYPYPYNDYDGHYSMTQNLFAIPITSKKQGDDIVKAIASEEFNMILKATKWGNYAIDYKLFKHFNADFYKSFLGKKNKTNKKDIDRNNRKTKKLKNFEKTGK